MLVSLGDFLSMFCKNSAYKFGCPDMFSHDLLALTVNVKVMLNNNRHFVP